MQIKFIRFIFSNNQLNFLFFIYFIQVKGIRCIKDSERNDSVNADVAKTLMTNIIERNQKGKIKNATLSLNSILKLISQIYAEKINNPQYLYNPAYVLIYDIFLNKYGLKKICETKYIQFLESIFFYLNVIKIKLFARFVRLTEPLENDEFNYYITSFKFFDEM